MVWSFFHFISTESCRMKTERNTYSEHGKLTTKMGMTCYFLWYCLFSSHLAYLNTVVELASHKNPILQAHSTSLKKQPCSSITRKGLSLGSEWQLPTETGTKAFEFPSLLLTWVTFGADPLCIEYHTTALNQRKNIYIVCAYTLM